MHHHISAASQVLTFAALAVLTTGVVSLAEMAAKGIRRGLAKRRHGGRHEA